MQMVDAGVATNSASTTDPVLVARAVEITFGRRAKVTRSRPAPVRAVRGVTLDVHAGRTLAIVGESGCGKSTLARLLLGLQDPTSGSIRFGGRELSDLSGADWQRYRSAVQVVFQDPGASLNPRKSVRRHLADVLLLHRKVVRSTVDRRVVELLESVGLTPASSYMTRKPSQLSGGQKQRVCIARAMAVEPQIIIADEALSALDVSVQAQILDLMRKLRRDAGVGFVIITHDLAVVENIADEVAVMYLGQVVEQGPKDRVLKEPRHPYTFALLAARLVADPSVPPEEQGKVTLRGEVPSPTMIPDGCSLHPRCPVALDECSTTEIPAHPPEVAAERANNVVHHSSCLRAETVPTLLQ